MHIYLYIGFSIRLTLILSSVVDEVRSQSALLHHAASPTRNVKTNSFALVSYEELTVMNLATIRAATDNFSDSNKLGQGGFGSVYKVLLLFSPDSLCLRGNMLLIESKILSGYSSGWEGNSR